MERLPRRLWRNSTFCAGRSEASSVRFSGFKRKTTHGVTAGTREDCLEGVESTFVGASVADSGLSRIAFQLTHYSSRRLDPAKATVHYLERLRRNARFHAILRAHPDQ